MWPTPMDDVWSLPEKDLAVLRESRVVLSMSGGKDSTACALLLERHGIEFGRVFMDTGWEHPAVYEYISDVLEPRFGPVETLVSSRYPDGMPGLVRDRYFPSRRARFCTEELKVMPFRAWVDRQSQDLEIVNVVGIRREESASRATAPRWDTDPEAGCDVFRPLVDHSFGDIIQMHQESQIPPNPLYITGSGVLRVGCFPCIFARKSELLKVAELWPERIDQIEAMEEEATAKNRARYKEESERTLRLRSSRVAFNVINDKRVRVLGLPPHNWTQWVRRLRKRPQPLACEEEEVEAATLESMIASGDVHQDLLEEESEAMLRKTFFWGKGGELGRLGIREIVEWAKTDRGGRQFRLFDEESQDGCVRWGMCDSALADAELVQVREGANG